MLDWIYKILIPAVIAIIGWAIRLESRVSVQDQKHLALKELIESRFDETSDRLDRIERVLNGALRGNHD